MIPTILTFLAFWLLCGLLALAWMLVIDEAKLTPVQKRDVVLFGLFSIMLLCAWDRHEP